MDEQKKDYTQIMLKCADIAKSRQAEYGEATQSINDGVKMCKDMFGLELSPKAFCQVMIAGKFARDKQMGKEDNMLDAINYIAIMLSL